MSKQQHESSRNVFDLIETICTGFRNQWKQGSRPRIEGYLDKVPQEARKTLFKNLLHAEISSRRQAKESPCSDEYLNRFPSFKRAIRQAFDEPTLMSFEQQDHLGSQHAGLTATIDFPAANRIGSYDLIRELGRGGFGVVYDAQHRKTGNRVALKTLPTGNEGQDVNADRLYRFRKEFRRLSEINHPNLVGMQTLEVDGNQWYFTMDLVEGEDFLSYVRPSGQVDESRLRASLSQLAKGVVALHQRRIIHRDLKPSNVLVGSDGRVKILDFGLAAQLQQPTDLTQTRSAMFAGTPRYAAPEQMFGERTEASDWYAFGTMLYEALTGHPPFQARDQIAILRDKQENDPKRLIGQSDIPTDLAELADGLVRRVATERLTGEVIIERLGIEQDSQRSSSSSSSSTSNDSINLEDSELEGGENEEIILIGREAQRHQLTEMAREFLRERRPCVGWITGLSGEGKSSLAENFLRPLRRGDKALVLSGRCYDRESVPYKAIDCIVPALVAFLRRQETVTVGRWLPEDIGFLAKLFPLLRRVDSIAAAATAEISQIDGEKTRHRAFRAFKELLSSLSAEYPIVISSMICSGLTRKARLLSISC